ncbi:zinc ion binding [Striga asiatica]|uniref:Zinc ion binding n=1 Tax=Striga asiatica TaxID=4170 RepID=A0A5A7PLG7_STRAF|nr:zinc ion binding [Striga asiatica]
MQPRVIPGSIAPHQFAEPVIGEIDKSKGVVLDSKSLEVVSSNNDLDSSKGMDKGDSKLGSSSFVPMDLDGSKAQDLDLSNLVHVPVGQIQQQGPVPKSQKSFIRLTRSKIVEPKNSKSEKQEWSQILFSGGCASKAKEMAGRWIGQRMEKSGDSHSEQAAPQTVEHKKWL